MRPNRSFIDYYCCCFGRSFVRKNWNVRNVRSLVAKMHFWILEVDPQERLELLLVLKVGFGVFSGFIRPVIDCPRSSSPSMPRIHQNSLHRFFCIFATNVCTYEHSNLYERTTVRSQPYIHIRVGKLIAFNWIIFRHITHQFRLRFKWYAVHVELLRWCNLADRSKVMYKFQLRRKLWVLTLFSFPH